jgi:hypothetical protein
MHIKEIGCAVILALLPACATAQVHSETVHQRNDCRLATQILQTGEPEPHTTWALQQIASCGPAGGVALANAIRRTRDSGDAPTLDAISEAARTFRDGEVFAAAVEVAADRTATIPARVFAFRTLITSLSPGRVLSYAQMTRSDVQRACSGLLPSTHDEITAGTALPVNAEEVAREISTQAAGEPGAPSELVHAASCLVRYTQP